MEHEKFHGTTETVYSDRPGRLGLGLAMKKTKQNNKFLVKPCLSHSTRVGISVSADMKYRPI